MAKKSIKKICQVSIEIKKLNATKVYQLIEAVALANDTIHRDKLRQTVEVLLTRIDV